MRPDPTSGWYLLDAGIWVHYEDLQLRAAAKTPREPSVHLYHNTGRGFCWTSFRYVPLVDQVRYTFLFWDRAITAAYSGDSDCGQLRLRHIIVEVFS